MKRLRATFCSLSLLVVSTGCVAAHTTAAELDRIVAALELRSGMVVADVGAGDGEWSEELARVVGAAGHLYATEVTAERVDEVRGRLDDTRLDNFTAILGDDSETGLPAGCCDAILLRLVYHHFTDPVAMRASLVRALRPGGRLVVIEIEPRTDWNPVDGVPDRGGHGIDPDALVEEMTGGGFEVVARHRDWSSGSEHYCVVFRRAPAGRTTP